MVGLRFIRALAADRRGNALIISALAMPAMLGAAGLAMETVQLTLVQRQLQRQADSAAMAGALAKAQGASAQTAATQSIARDNLVALSKAPVIENGPTTGAYAGNTGAVRVVLEATQSQPFSGVFLQKAATLKVEATAASMTNGNYCVVSLESSSAVGITLQGNSTVNMGCGLATNSKGVPALNTGGSSTVTASHISAVGGIKSTLNYAQGTVLLPFSIPQKDPYAALPTPTVPSPCNTQMRVNSNATGSFTPGCYAGVDIKGTANLASGIYIVNGGTVSFGAQAVVNGPGVTFVLTSSTAATNPSSIATLDMAGGATVKLTATTTGTYAGVLFYQDRRALPGTVNKINGNSTSILQGGAYFRSQDLSFTGNSGMQTDCLQLVSRRVTFTGNNRIVNECPSDSGAGSFIGTRVYLVG